VYLNAIKLQKNESRNGSIGNKCYIKNVYLNTFDIKIVNMSFDLQRAFFTLRLEPIFGPKNAK
jgi:hypothetical protein